MAFIKVTQIVKAYAQGIQVGQNEIINWVNSDSIDRLIDDAGTHICFVSGSDIEVKETLEEILKQIPEDN